MKNDELSSSRLYSLKSKEFWWNSDHRNFGFKAAQVCKKSKSLPINIVSEMKSQPFNTVIVSVKYRPISYRKPSLYSASTTSTTSTSGKWFQASLASHLPYNRTTCMIQVRFLSLESKVWIKTRYCWNYINSYKL